MQTTFFGLNCKHTDTLGWEDSCNSLSRHLALLPSACARDAPPGQLRSSQRQGHIPRKTVLLTGLACLNSSVLLGGVSFQCQTEDII